MKTITLHEETKGETNPIREFLWSIGNSTTGDALCEALADLFHVACPWSDVVDKEICPDYKAAYTARCSAFTPGFAGEGTFLYLSATLLVVLTLASLLRLKKILSVPDAALTISLGLITGGFVMASKQEAAKAKFDEQVFFDVLLPIIVFEAGYGCDKRSIRKRAGLIFSLAVLGTLISFGVITALMYGLSPYFYQQLTLLDSAVFASLISSTDPVAVVTVFSAMGVDPKLYALIFGESMLNDCVAVALYASMKHFYSATDLQGWNAFLYVVGEFLLVSMGSLTMGFLFGVVIARFWKWAREVGFFVHPVLETLCYTIAALIPYYLADSLKWSGIVCVAAESVALSLYAHPNLSRTSSFHFLFLVECLSRLFEALTFGYLGVQLVVNEERIKWTGLVPLAVLSVLFARAVATFPIFGVHNLCLKLRGRPATKFVPFNHQFVVWFSGLRGALAFALAITIPSWDKVTEMGSKQSGELLACTCTVILLNVFIFGGCTPYVLKAAKVRTSSTSSLSDGLLNSSSSPAQYHHQQESTLLHSLVEAEQLPNGPMDRLHRSLFVWLTSTTSSSSILHTNENDLHENNRASMVTSSPLDESTYVQIDPIGPDDRDTNDSPPPTYPRSTVSFLSSNPPNSILS